MASGDIRAEEQVTERSAQQIGDPTLRQMVRAVVDQMTALAQAFQVARSVVARIVVEMGRGKHDAGAPHADRLLDVG